VDAETIQDYLNLEKEIAAAEQSRYYVYLSQCGILEVATFYGPSVLVQYFFKLL
jgi:hypothetical protein